MPQGIEIQRGIEWLRTAAQSGEVHTVRVSFADRLGVWRGKRVPVDLFLDGAPRSVGFCDGMLVCDVHADLVQETPFSNYETGYPDFFVHPDLDDVRPVGWTIGEALAFGDLRDEHGHVTAVAPRSALARVAERAAALGLADTVRLSVSGRLMRSPKDGVELSLGLILGPGDRVLAEAADALGATGFLVDDVAVDRDGWFELSLAPLAPRLAGEAGVVVKGALKECARSAGLEAVFMTRSPVGPRPALWRIEMPVRPEGVDAAQLARRAAILLADVRGLIAPSVTAFRSGRLPVDVSQELSCTTMRVAASAEASPETAVACAVAAACEAWVGATHVGAEPASLVEAADRLEISDWACEWLGTELPRNSAPLLRAEQAMFDAAITDWEVDRYWKAG